MYILKDIYNLFLHHSLSSNNIKNNKNIFAFSSKKNLIKARGLILKHESELLDQVNQFSHWTPNTYINGAYADAECTIIKGHSEKNLHQINTFMIDFDLNASSSITEQDILSAAQKLDMKPTIILKTPHGYHAYFALLQPIYIDNNNTIYEVKKISEYIRERFSIYLPVDFMCNHFGVSRIPRIDNIVYFDPNNCFSFNAWKTKYNDFNSLSTVKFFNDADICTKKELPNKLQTSEKWFKLLLQSTDIKGQRNTYGRNNVIFTLALACYASQYPKAKCYQIIFKFNKQLKAPLSKNEVEKTINSAYSGKYQAASSFYIKKLSQQWLQANNKIYFNRYYWYKHKKQRCNRIYSHLNEWEKDLLLYLNQKTSIEQPFITYTQKELSSSLNIPLKSFTRLIKKLKHEHKIIYKIKKGRYGGLTIALNKFICKNIIKNKQISIYCVNTKKRKNTNIYKKLYKTKTKTKTTYLNTS